MRAWQHTSTVDPSEEALPLGRMASTAADSEVVASDALVMGRGHKKDYMAFEMPAFGALGIEGPDIHTDSSECRLSVLIAWSYRDVKEMS